jgi:hypothetical protein
MNKLFEPKNRREQVEGVVEYYDKEYPLFLNYPHGGHTPSSMLYYVEVLKLVAYMFMKRDVTGYRFEVMRAYLEDMNTQSFDEDAPAISV